MQRDGDVRQTLVGELSGDVARLVRPYTHSEAGRTSRHPSLFNQLRAELVRGTPNDGPGRTSTESKPPTSTDLLALSIDVVYVPAQLAARVVQKTRRSPEANLSLVVGAAGGLPIVELTWATREVEALRLRIERALSWEHEPMQTTLRCPSCGRKTILVMMDDYGPSGAACTKCKTKWDRGSLGILALQLAEEDEG